MKEGSIAEIAIIIQNREAAAQQVNEILTQYGNFIVTRLGVPFRERGLYLISIVLEATEDEIRALTERLEQVPEVKVKSIAV